MAKSPALISAERQGLQEYRALQVQGVRWGATSDSFKSSLEAIDAEVYEYQNYWYEKLVPLQRVMEFGCLSRYQVSMVLLLRQKQIPTRLRTKKKGFGFDGTYSLAYSHR
eukprot:2519848-Rhodomonas_salina.1